MGRKTQFCISCQNHWGLKRLYERTSKVTGRKDDYRKKFSQPAKGIGWRCPDCGAMFTDEQAQKCRAKMYGIRDVSDEAIELAEKKRRTVPYKYKAIKGLDELVPEIQDPRHYFR